MMSGILSSLRSRGTRFLGLCHCVCCKKHGKRRLFLKLETVCFERDCPNHSCKVLVGHGACLYGLVKDAMALNPKDFISASEMLERALKLLQDKACGMKIH
ncbi:uncharacterized protein LOC110614925 isoform X2 [Manihot esculenta]|uniref:uncharacterized protein LOC110614925 isoform X2 n=1 Tax=Manihot esculenta TaxID=3983 RepID=UPI000B5D20FD|nr:uncharacterized protein LOC110614925 isoform X2 [Manihot esculenta]